MKIADYGKAMTSYIEAPTRFEKNLSKKIAEQESSRLQLAEGSDDQPLVPEKKPKQLKDLYERIDRTVLAIRSNTIPPEYLLPALEDLTQQYIGDGLISGEDARKFATERMKFYDTFIQKNEGATLPTFDFDNEGNEIEVSEEEIIKRINRNRGGRVGLAIGGGLIHGKKLGSREGFFAPAIYGVPIGLNVARTAATPLIRKGLEIAAGTGIGKRISDTFFSEEDETGKSVTNLDTTEINNPEKNKMIKGPDDEPPTPKFDEIARDFLIEEAVTRLKKKEMNPDKRDKRTKLAVELDLPVTRSGMFEIRKGDFLENRLETLKEKGVNFDGYYSVPEIANLLGTQSSSGINSFITDKNIPFVKKGLYKVVKLNDFLNTYQGTKERIDVAPPVEIGTAARIDFLKEVGGNFYQRFKDMRRPKFLPPEVKEIYEKYDLGEIEGGHPFPIEFFTKKFGKGNTLQDDRQFDWIYRNKDKLFSKNNLVFQSKEVNKLFRNKIKELKKHYKELAPYVDKYEGKGEITNKMDIKKIEELNNNIMEIIGKSEFDAKKYIEESDNKADLKRFKTGGLHGAIFNTDTGEVSLYTGAGEGAGFEAIGKEPENVKLKIFGDYTDIVNNIITDKGDKEIFTKYINDKLLPKFQKGGPVYGKYAKQIAGIS